MDTLSIKEYFPELSEPELIDEIQKVGVFKDFKAGDILIDVGSYIKTIPLIVEGNIKIVREDDGGHEMLMYYLEGGETCSMSLTCCLSDKQSSIRAIAESDGKLIAIPVSNMDEWMLKYRSWKNFVMNSYRNRFDELLHIIDCIAFHKMDDRVTSYLRNKSEVTNSYIIKTTHQEIASDLNSSREVISRLLKQLEKQGKIKLGRNIIDTTNLV